MITYVVFCISPRGPVKYICTDTEFIIAAPHRQLPEKEKKLAKKQ